MIMVSVIIPNYNHAPFLKQRIESVLAQTYADLELILLDDCSTDHSREILSEYSHHPKVSHLVFNDTNSGSPFKQWAKGIKLAKGKWIWIAESDDTAEPEFLQTVLTKAVLGSDVGLSYSDSTISPKKNSFKKFSDWKNSYYKTDRWAKSYCESGIDEINNYLQFTNTINNSSASIFLKEDLLTNAPRLEEFTYYGDWYLFLTVAARHTIAYSNEALSHYNEHPNSQLNRPIDPIKQRKDYFMLLDLLYQVPELKDKRRLVNFFSLQYLNYGLLKEKNIGKKAYAEWKVINKRLAKKVRRRIWLQKLAGKKPQPIY